MSKNGAQPLKLCLLALANYGLFYGLTVFLARTLDTQGFEIYSVAVATVTLLASLTTLGLEKYALRALPAYFEHQDWDHGRGYVWFSWRTILLTSIGVGLAYSVLRYVRTARDDQELRAVLIAIAFLPAAALAQFFIEVLTSSGGVVRATAAYRLLFPATVVVFVLAASRLPGGLDATRAVLGYSSGWLVALAVLIVLARRGAPAPIWSAAKSTRPAEWLRSAAPFLLHSVMMTQFASLGIIGLELVGRGERSVALLAACMQTGSFVVLLATATNRLYSPKLSVLIEHRDYEGMLKTIRERLAWLGPVTAAYFLIMVFFGREILSLYGPQFREGYPALVWIAAGASISVLFAMAPNYLKFVGKNHQVLGITVAFGLLNVTLLLALGPRWGATGAGAAYGISLALMAIVFRVLGLRTARVETQA